MKLYTHFFLILCYFLALFQIQAQVNITLIKTDCAKNFQDSFCEEAYQAVDTLLDSLQHSLHYKYVSSNSEVALENLLAVQVNFKYRSETGDTCLNFSIKDVATQTSLLRNFCIGPIQFNLRNIHSGLLNQYLWTIHKNITGLTPSWSEVIPQTYFPNPSLFFEFDKINFEVKLDKNTRKEIYVITHNILAQQQIWERKFNFRSKYTKQKIEKTEDTQLHITFEENPEDKHTFIIHIYLLGEKVIDLMPYTNEKIDRKVIVNKARINNGDYVELIDKLSLIYTWILINTDI